MKIPLKPKKVCCSSYPRLKHIEIHLLWRPSGVVQRKGLCVRTHRCSRPRLTDAIFSRTRPCFAETNGGVHVTRYAHTIVADHTCRATPVRNRGLLRPSLLCVGMDRFLSFACESLRLARSHVKNHHERWCFCLSLACTSARRSLHVFVIEAFGRSATSSSDSSASSFENCEFSHSQNSSQAYSKRWAGGGYR